ncbi:hypothetical protein F442_09138 [Phytophthora nicotianae P10297]|uniref:Ubiquitin-like protease family profile domain-containing protein n=1 Tax=Phytophthora nicotianae P10297 TaxID=1317064 RepID=W2ZA74_PHYNI|nr:hypothetical protein F442_09138 [Phytophthora nicotianae P10297]
MAPDERCDEEWVDSSAESSGTSSSTGTGSSTSKQRRSDGSGTVHTTQSGEEPVEIASPPEKTEFDSWGALDAYLKAYSAETYQSFRVRTNNKVTTRNKKIQDCGSTKPLVPEEWVYYSKTFVCTHAGKYKPRGKGKRKRQESRALDCDVQLGSVGLSWVWMVYSWVLVGHCWAHIDPSNIGISNGAVTTDSEYFQRALVIDPSNIGISNGAVTTDSEYFQRALARVTKKMKVLFPINCNNNHWCAVLMDMQKGRVYVYDSMASSYADSVRAVAQKMIMMLPDGVRPSARLVTHDPGLGVQSDSYNCGVYVLLAFEIFCGSEPLGHLDKKTLQCMRYRYLRMCMKEEGSSNRSWMHERRREKVSQ